MELAIVVIVAALIIAAIVMRRKNWKVMAAGNGSTADEVQTKYNYLKENNIKCKLRTDESPTMGAVQGSGAYDGMHSVVLSVHAKDVDRATELLEAFDREAELSLNRL